ncbi:TIGR03084 family metal-binding protein [Dactylosporangium sp. NPDC051484]|uniref:TIGR03084 family metal-binding protein n=1 Tax=Dactylosporangium sp. NPDC051484 TaxID=3154942 RepID=UPI00344E7DEF
MTEQPKVISNLTADGNDVDRLVSDLDAEQWALPTPAVGWTVAHQIAHLAATFRMAGMAAADPDRFIAMTGRLGSDFNANVTAALSEYVVEPPAELLRRWRAERAAAEKSIGALPMDQLVPWLVRPLPAMVLAMAGMMELFAHGQDIADALGVRRRVTDRIGQVVHFAVRTWDFGYQSRGLQTPDVAFRFEITAPSGAVWEFGPADSPERITGPAEDFCLLVTRRRHRDDLAVVAAGELAEQWLDIAQAYRGPAGPGRQAGQFSAA